MADKAQREIYVRDGETLVPQTGTEGGVSGVPVHYILRAETGVLTGLLFGERSSDRVQGEADEQRSNKDDSSQEGQS